MRELSLQAPRTPAQKVKTGPAPRVEVHTPAIENDEAPLEPSARPPQTPAAPALRKIAMDLPPPDSDQWQTMDVPPPSVRADKGKKRAYA
jgi:hypothetical protein